MRAKTSLRTPEVKRGPDLTRRIYSVLASRLLQPLWRFLHFISLRGMGYKNIYPTVNGENRYLRCWAKTVSRNAESPVVIDVGANEGDFAQRVLSLMPKSKIHCFEPNSATFKRLAGRFRSDNRVFLNELGLGAASASGTLFDLSDDGTGQASFLQEALAVRDESQIALSKRSVKLMALDEYVQSHRIDNIDLLKIDVEGYERDVLQGAQATIDRGVIKVVQLEWNYHNAITGFTFYELSKLLSDFEIYRLLPRGLTKVLGREVSYRPESEIFVYCNLVAVRRTYC